MSKPTTTTFRCTRCGAQFSVPPAALEKYPGWVPKVCLKCKSAKGQARGARPPRPRPPQLSLPGASSPPGAPRPDDQPAGSPPPSREGSRGVPQVVDPGGLQEVDPHLEAALDEVLRRFSQGPQDGIFTDGGCSGNPGPGGWGAIRVQGGQIVGRRFGSEAMTTNNRMELTALIAAYRMVDPEEKVTIWSDSQLCVNTINTWAAGWERKGWRRKGGPIKNLDLVKDLYYLARSRPRATLCWVKAHNGSRWNEYVDVLATATLR